MHYLLRKVASKLGTNLTPVVGTNQGTLPNQQSETPTTNADQLPPSAWSMPKPGSPFSDNKDMKSDRALKPSNNTNMPSNLYLTYRPTSMKQDDKTIDDGDEDDKSSPKKPKKDKKAKKKKP